MFPCQVPETRRKYARSYYDQNKQRLQQAARDAVSARRKRNREWLITYLTGKVCTDCGHSDIRVLEFDHLSDKLFAVADLVSRGRSLERIQAEVAKCELVCCNCHHLRTCRRRGDTWHELKF